MACVDRQRANQHQHRGLALTEPPAESQSRLRTSDIVVSIAVSAAHIGLLSVMFVIGRRILRSRIRAGSPVPVTVDAGGVVTILVVATITGLRLASPLLALASNNLDPRLAIGPFGQEHRVLAARTEPLDLIASVDVRKGPDP